jgi:hypothetical protein
MERHASEAGAGQDPQVADQGAGVAGDVDHAGNRRAGDGVEDLAADGLGSGQLLQ